MGWLPAVNIYRVPEGYRTEGWEQRRQTYWGAYAVAQRTLFKAMLRAGETIFAGTDANVPVMAPGFSLHQELRAMQDAGMTPAQVLAAATSTPGAWMELRTGQIRQGYDANLVLLREDPLADIDATDAIEMVFVNGRVLDRAQLDDLLRAVRVANNESRRQNIAPFR